jgi:LAO/AO transport system kinase
MILSGSVRAAARLMRDIEDGMPGTDVALKELYRHTGRARVIGITGSPGAGKSTICDQLIKAYRNDGKKVGVVAVDPSSPYSGGALLGDRIRMQEHATDPGVFIRSMATRGNLGGLSASTCDVIKVMDAMGCDMVLVETVGVGQDEIDIARAAHTTIVVLIPGMGDDIQAIKAGLLEVADCFVVNKADRDGADKVERELRVMLDMRGARKGEWTPPIVRMVALKGEGIDSLKGAVAQHGAFLADDTWAGALAVQRRKCELVEVIRSKLRIAVDGVIDSYAGGIDAISAELGPGGRDPYSVADELIEKAIESLSEKK